MAEGQPIILMEEFFDAEERVKADGKVIPARKLWGLSSVEVWCPPYSAGTYGNPDEAGHRLLKFSCLVPPRNEYGSPVLSRDYSRCTTSIPTPSSR